jgi:hypothetical protein
MRRQHFELLKRSPLTMTTRYKILLVFLMTELTLLIGGGVIGADAEVTDLKNASHPVVISEAPDAIHHVEYFLNISTPTQIRFFCEQQDKIVLIDAKNRERYISKVGSFTIVPVPCEMDCGAGHCACPDLLGNYHGRSNLAMCDDLKDENEMKRCFAKFRESVDDHDADLDKNGFQVEKGPFSKEGCRAIAENLSAICITERRSLYIHREDNKTVYTTYDFKSPIWNTGWEVTSTNIASSRAKWGVGPGDQAAIHFENDGYEYRFEIQHPQSFASGAVSVFKGGKQLQTESCKLLYLDKDLLPASKNP